MYDELIDPGLIFYNSFVFNHLALTVISREIFSNVSFFHVSKAYFVFKHSELSFLFFKSKSKFETRFFAHH